MSGGRQIELGRWLDLEDKQIVEKLPLLNTSLVFKIPDVTNSNWEK